MRAALLSAAWAIWGGAARIMLIVAAQPAFAMGGGGPPDWPKTLNYCREAVTSKGITDVTRFDQEVKKCVANPASYPPAYAKPGQ